MKSKKPQAGVARQIEMLAVRPVRREETGYLIEILRIHGTAIKIPSSKLGTHETALRVKLVQILSSTAYISGM
jgi:hypothetical protein